MLAMTTFLPTDLAHFRQQQLAKQHLWYQSNIFSSWQSEYFKPEYWQQQQAVIGQSKGRNTAWFIQYQQTKLVLRHYYRGGLVGKLLSDQFFITPVNHSRAMQEFTLLRRMHGMGLPVPRPVAASYQQQGLIYRASIIIELVPYSQDLATVMSQRQLTAQEWQNVGQTIAKFHQQGVYHSDLNCRNILLDDNGKVWLIDFDKCELRQAGAWQQQNLQRLQRSLLKEQGLSNQFYWQQQQWQDLEQGYKLQKKT